MVALWLAGIEDRPERSAEICVTEFHHRDAEPVREAEPVEWLM